MSEWDHPYLAELRAFSRSPRPTSAEEFIRHKGLLACALHHSNQIRATSPDDYEERRRLMQIAQEDMKRP